jgi:glutathione synthase/RimK-type ligase-like ATP-grasp enzyme
MGSRALAKALGGKRIKRENSRFKGRADKVVINWGCGSLPREVLKCQVVNAPEAVSVAANKRKFFEAMRGTGLTPAFCTGPGAALNAMSEGGKVVVRHKLTGRGGKGMEICEKGAPIPEAPLYVEYIPKKEEFRVHVINGRAVDVARKARSKAVPDHKVDWQMRNTKGGFIFARKGVEDFPHLDRLKVMGELAVQHIGLDFGAVDVIWNEKQGRFYVLEINTAPGLQGSTLGVYAEGLKAYGPMDR